MRKEEKNNTPRKYKYFVFIQFEGSQKAYTFGANTQYHKGQDVVVETVRGKEIGTVCAPTIDFDAAKAKGDTKPVIRLATEYDLVQKNENKIRAKKAMKICRSCIENLGLDMHLISGEYTLDRSKVIFTYVSDQRVDFRQLLKDLAQQLHCRIELRQIGPRNKAKMIGGLGNCGMETCCSRFMSDFETVSINMAKNQLLALNISKLSGQCGKLMCCLRFENEEYTRMRKDLPKLNSQINFDGKRYRITSMNVLQKQAKLENKEETKFVSFEELWPDKDFSDGSTEEL
ncbi:regulatory iron-sulfur-containing complex subunit RicT [Catenisphaera adipataccumulans]|jgi:cell fate regulator YaaT (PSP1 superfamily)|uniref:Cell fate regulator YaaT (PSP1 superfamily) n=1 Tax=Catenisphaera adipataccumulans TaxID=700500 RepID=A0A7W8CYB6_9FIRM|nr:regulatory iron-sulfur-containing complex subunit RicT [Catenisphaera adipataccumulans]MBB5183816.1 cell fate regulator YaaT (PSP1 superfamily) [Catenisphaera adipataccumulans]